MPSSPSSIDLTSVQNVRSWLSSTNPSVPLTGPDDSTIQDMITGFSNFFLIRTGHGPQDGSQPESSPFIEPVSYSEVYDGNGSTRLFLRNRPIQNVEGLQIGNRIHGPSTAYNLPGWIIDGTKLSLSLRGGDMFWKDTQNVFVQYTAGFLQEPADIEMAARKSIGLTYRRKDWQGIKSKSLAQGAGSVSYDFDWELEPDVIRLIAAYTRYAIV